MSGARRQLVKPQEIHSRDWRREMAFLYWAAHGGPECPVKVVSGALRVPLTKLNNWRYRDGWDAKWEARMRGVEERLEEESEFRMSDLLSVEKLNRTLVALFLGMTKVVQEGGLEPKPKHIKVKTIDEDGNERITTEPAERPVVTFRVRDFVDVIERIEQKLIQEKASEDHPELGVAKGPARYVPRRDLELMSRMDPQSVAKIRTIGEMFFDELQSSKPVKAKVKKARKKKTPKKKSR